MNTEFVPEQRGAIVFSAERFATVYLSPRLADGTTLPHEFGHLFLEMYTHLATKSTAGTTLKNDYSVLLKWMGLTDAEWRGMSLQEREPYHERFAEAFVTFLSTRFSPTPGVHREFEAWLSEIQQTLGMPPGVTTKMIELFERLVPPVSPSLSDPLMSAVQDALIMATRTAGCEAPEAVAGVLAATYKRLHMMSGMRPAAFLREFDIDVVGLSPAVIRDQLSRAHSQTAHTRGLLNQFAGVQALSHPKGELAQAREMLARGVGMRNIHRRTGWHRGWDNGWRFEISDRDARLLRWPIPTQGVLLAEVLDHPALFLAYPGLCGITLINGEIEEGARACWLEEKNTIILNAPPDEQTALSSILHETQHAIQTVEGFARGGSAKSDFTNTIKMNLHAGLQFAERDLDRTRLEHWHLTSQLATLHDKALSAKLLASADKLVDYAHSDSPSRVKKHIEGHLQWLYDDRFQKNDELRAQCSDMQRRYWALPKRHNLVKRNAFLRDFAMDAAQLLRKAIPPVHLQALKASERPAAAQGKSLSRQANRIWQQLQPVRLKEDGVRKNQALWEHHRITQSAYSIYQSLAGEVEARNTQTRHQMDDQQRQDSYPMDTEDVAPDQVIVTFRGLKVAPPSLLQSIGTLIDNGQSPHDAVSMASFDLYEMEMATDCEQAVTRAR